VAGNSIPDYAVYYLMQEQQPISNSIAFFDFDGTITDRDIFFDFIFYRLRKGLSIWKIMRAMPILAAYILKLMDNETAKEKIFGILFKAESLIKFQQTVDAYYQTCFAIRLRPAALEKIRWHQSAAHRVVIVSANFSWLIQPFAATHQLEMIATEAAVDAQIITGKFATPNCYGEEKVRRIQAVISSVSAYEHIYAYGDSRGDTAMLQMATDPFYKAF
jgi:HAD superfamily hydrolase (TIGR01490 family)